MAGGSSGGGDLRAAMDRDRVFNDSTDGEGDIVVDNSMALVSIATPQRSPTVVVRYTVYLSIRVNSGYIRPIILGRVIQGSINIVNIHNYLILVWFSIT